ncbi:short-chain collagen C4-like [Crassostrea virginica]
MALVIVLVFFVLLANAEKRILLNDQDVILSQLHALERKVEEVTARNVDLAVKYNALATQTNEMQAKIVKIPTQMSGGIFVRWGRKDCLGNHTELIYSGYAGGSWYDHAGAAAEFVCLPPDPDLTTKYTSSYAFIYGAEYDTYDFEPRAERGNDLPCSVCQSTVGSSVLMIPGKSSCYDGWSLQYHGDLVAGHYTYKSATQYICLDVHYETIPGGQIVHNGKLFYPVKAACGSLTCPPYHNDRYLTCAVCTK